MMTIYTPIGNYDLDYYLTSGIIGSWNRLDFTVVENDGAVTLSWIDTNSSNVNKTMLLTGVDLVVENNSIISGTITGIELWVFDFEFFAGEFTGTNLDGVTFQNHIDNLIQGDYIGFFNAVISEASLVVGTSDAENYEHNFDYPAININLMGGDDSYTHQLITTSINSLTIDGGEGYDRFYTGHRGGLNVIDLENNLFIDTGGNEHVIMNFEFVHGSNGSDEIYGVLGETNLLYGSGGNDFIQGGNQNDTLNGGAGSDTIYGLDGDDLIVGGYSPDTLYGGTGSDTVSYLQSFSSVSVDLLTGIHSGALAVADVFHSIENLIGTNLGDSLAGDNDDNHLDGKDGNDTIKGRSGNDTIIGGDGNDTIEGGIGADSLDGGDGRDMLSYITSNARVIVDLIANMVSGGDADGDTIVNFEHISGSHYNDSLRGNAAANHILGQDGADILFGLAGEDSIIGGEGNDTIIGGNDNDTIDGGLGNDILRGNGGNDHLFGQEGIDDISSGSGNDFIFGGSGQGIYRGQGGNDNITGGIDEEMLYGGSGDDTLSGENGNDRLFGQGNNDSLHGGEGNDTLFGGAGQDTLFGGAGDDRLSGSSGAGYLDGGVGNDTLIGGAQADDFVFKDGYGTDRVNGFQQGLDDILLSDDLWVDTFGNLTAEQIITILGTINGTNTVITLDFGDGDVLEVFNGAGLNLSALADDLIFV